MKLLISIFLFSSTFAYAEDNCLKVTFENNEAVNLCNNQDANLVRAFKCDVKSSKCFVGSAAKIVTMINSGMINEGDAYIALGLRLSENAVQFQYGDSSGFCKHVANRCH